MAGKPLGFGKHELTTPKKPAKHERFQTDMEQMVPWHALIEPHSPKTGSSGGRPAYRPATSFWASAQLLPRIRASILCERIPDATTILVFRQLLERHNLGALIFETVKTDLKDGGMVMKQWMIIAATLIAAP